MIEMPEATTIAGQMNAALAGKIVVRFGRGRVSQCPILATILFRKKRTPDATVKHSSLHIHESAIQLDCPGPAG